MTSTTEVRTLASRERLLVPEGSFADQDPRERRGPLADEAEVGKLRAQDEKRAILSWAICLLLKPAEHFHQWLNGLMSMFGVSFVALVILADGLNQGFQESLLDLSSTYFWKDTLPVQPATAQALQALSGLPWDVKPVYGLIMDSFPIFGYRMCPYLILMGSLSAVCLLGLGALPPGIPVSLATYVAVGALMGTNLGGAFADVVVDAAVAKNCQREPSMAADLQSLATGSGAVGSLLGFAVGGPLIRSIGPQGSLFVLSFAPMALVVIAAVLPESKVKPRPGEEEPRSSHWPQDADIFTRLSSRSSPVSARRPCSPQAPRSPRAAPQSCQPGTAGGGGGGGGTAAMGTGKSGGGGVWRLWWSMGAVWRSITEERLWKPMLYIFLMKALVPDISDARFFWATDDPGGPLFTPNFMGSVYAFGNVGMLLGVWVYSRWLRAAPMRPCFAAAQGLLCMAGLLDIVLVTRANLVIGIPDSVFVVGDEAVSRAVERIQMMPILTLAASLCSPGIEGSVFATLMAFNKFGGHSGGWLGALLLKSLRVQQGAYERLWVAMAIRSFMRLLPIGLLFLVPDEESDVDFHGFVEDQGGNMATRDCASVVGSPRIQV